MSETLNPEQLYQQAMSLLNISQATMNEGTVQEAYQLLKESANGGNSRAAYAYANYQYYTLGDHAEAFGYVSKAISEDPAGDAHYLLGLLYYHGKACEKNDPKSYELHTEAAVRGNKDAMFELYAYYSQGIGCTPDAAKAFDWNKKAAEVGQYRACYNMGWFYETGTHVDQDLNKALQFYKTASENGNGKATAYVGVMYEKGMIEPPETLDDDGNWDEEKARKIAYTWYRKAENEQDFYMIYDFLESLDLYYDEDEYADED